MSERIVPPPEGVRHEVKDGEWVGSIAMLYGFAEWEKDIWMHPENEELRKKRQGDPHLLFKGDILFIPPYKKVSVSCATGTIHKFKLKTPSEVFRTVVADEDGQPYANEPYELEIDYHAGAGKFKQQNEKTDANGSLCEIIPSTVKSGILRLPRLDLEFVVNFGYLNPVDKSKQENLVYAAQQRLDALGFNPGVIDGVCGPATKAAIRRFQMFCKHLSDTQDANAVDAGEVDGLLGEKTQAALSKLFGM